jgi:prepilin-type N-terminal cleavage/methylation domain-containing protein
MKASASPNPRLGFTLIELLVVLSIIALLGVLALPEYSRLLDKARSSACMGNLRSLGVATGLYVADNDGKFPYINNPARPLYTEEEELPEGVEALTMIQAFGPYGVTEKGLRCPADVAMNNRFASEGTSYEWRPMLDGEEKASPTIYSRRGAFNLQRLGRFRLVIDTDPVHFGRQNRLFADGRVQMFQ